MNIDKLQDFMGKGETKFFFGVVEDIADPLSLGRVKVRAFGYHSEDTDLISTKDLPWSMVMMPSTSASTSGIGMSPGLQSGSQVFGIFLDEFCQYPLVLGSIPTIHRPSAPQNPGNSPSGYTNVSAQNQYAAGDVGTPEGPQKPYHGQGQEGANGAENPKYHFYLFVAQAYQHLLVYFLMVFYQDANQLFVKFVITNQELYYLFYLDPKF